MRIFKQAFESIQGKKGEEENKPGSKGAFYIEEQFMTPEFLYKQNNKEVQQGTQKKINLTKQFFVTMATMENKFNLSPIKQINMVDQLVGMYQECIQQYDTLMDPIKYYFLDKIRNIVQQADKFTQREPRSLQSSEKKIQQPIQIINNDVSYFKDFQDFNDRMDKPTEYATPKNEDQYQQIDNKKLVIQLQTFLEEGQRNKDNQDISIKNHESPQTQINEIKQVQKFDESSSKKRSPKIEFRNENNETPIPKLLLHQEEQLNKQNVVDSQLQNQSRSIQDRLLARQKSQKKKDI
ncbi:unnamed protein product (macronuclear) [Paramecium tetraurelia]|uniref:Uncharacterized protein n=1 Tax=Paramecium tetraurelia TaxID=5888 RepID=A0CIU0_PARTE|nr:uncharacterized protein GSPATT00007842001 [Paramecium tetraurelia]CAK70707.1 unnamed protein product [Paramecium tetraurelia]|eukprot:XP_001438104.1 hypothetical protein (macronuclear) [Paramecium tetraurelia strain d4-2]